MSFFIYNFPDPFQRNQEFFFFVCFIWWFSEDPRGLGGAMVTQIHSALCALRISQHHLVGLRRRGGEKVGDYYKYCQQTQNCRMSNDLMTWWGGLYFTLECQFTYHWWGEYTVSRDRLPKQLIWWNKNYSDYDWSGGEMQIRLEMQDHCVCNHSSLNKRSESES